MTASYGFKPWTRASNGILAGVCQALAERFAVDVMLVRLVWLFSVLFFGAGLGLYFILAVSLPRADKLQKSSEAKLLGVCTRFAARFDLDIGLTRAGFCLLLFLSGGTFFFVYLLLLFILPKELGPTPPTGTDF
jgi:phage shock protein PspC (stress-responsive transcriptional regulator)